MFRSTNAMFDKLLEKATSHIIMEPDWPSILQICDLIRQNDIQPKYALNAIKKKLASTNPHTALYALLLLESVVKNCGNSVHEELTTKMYCDVLHDLAKTTPHEDVRQKLLELIQAWTFAFRKNPKYVALKDTMNVMKAEGYKFPVLRESDAMFSADTAPEWLDGNMCHRCHVQFSLMQRKHHCRACGQVFCQSCSMKNTSLPKFGIEKEVRVCDACYDHYTKPTSSKASTEKQETELPPEYVNSSLAQQNQAPPRKNEDELREEEELQLALALSQSEAEAKEKEKMRATSVYGFKPPEPLVERSLSPSPPMNPELAKYLNRNFWESRQKESIDENRPTSPSAPATAPSQNSEPKLRENGVPDIELEDFVNTLKGQVEIFINRMKSNSSRGRSIATDSSVQTIFLNITDMHSRLLRYIQQHDDSRLHYERLQDKLTQIKDARAALDALREEHRDKLRRQAEEAERQRQLQMAHKLEIMRKKKQEYLQYQRQLALQRIQEQEREMQMRQEQQKQQYMMPQYGNYIGSPIHGQQFSPNSAPPAGYYQYAQPMMPPHNMPGQMPPGLPQTAPQIRMGATITTNMQPMPGTANYPQGPPQGMHQAGQQQVLHQPGPPQAMHQVCVPQQVPPSGLVHGPPPGLPAPNQLQMKGLQPGSTNLNMQQHGGPPHSTNSTSIIGQPGMPPTQPGMPPTQQGLPGQFQQPGAPPASPQNQTTEANSGTQTAELISFD